MSQQSNPSEKPIVPGAKTSEVTPPNPPPPQAQEPEEKQAEHHSHHLFKHHHHHDKDKNNGKHEKKPRGKLEGDAEDDLLYKEMNDGMQEGIQPQLNGGPLSFK